MCVKAAPFPLPRPSQRHRRPHAATRSGRNRRSVSQSWRRRRRRRPPTTAAGGRGAKRGTPQRRRPRPTAVGPRKWARGRGRHGPQRHPLPHRHGWRRQQPHAHGRCGGRPPPAPDSSPAARRQRSSRQTHRRRRPLAAPPPPLPANRGGGGRRRRRPRGDGMAPARAGKVRRQQTLRRPRPAAAAAVAVATTRTRARTRPGSPPHAPPKRTAYCRGVDGRSGAVHHRSRHRPSLETRRSPARRRRPQPTAAARGEEPPPAQWCLNRVLPQAGKESDFMPQRLANVVVALRNAQRNVGTFSKILRYCRVHAYWQKYFPRQTQLTEKSKPIVIVYASRGTQPETPFKRQ